MAHRRALWAISFVLAACLTGTLAYLWLMTTFAPWDDEGYALMTVSEYLRGGALYDDVFSQYGPFFAQFWGAVFGGLGIEVTNSAARIIALVAWLTTSVVSALSVWRLTRSGALAVATQLVVFITLRSLSTEPLHPSALTCILLVAIVTVAAFWFPARPVRGAGLLGALIGTLLLVKVNVGGFALIAALLAAALTLPGLADRRAVRLGVAGASLLMPFVLMAGNLDQAWGRRYALVVVAAVASVVVTAWPETRSGPAPTRAIGPRLALVGAGGLAAVVAVICVLAIATGTSPGGLVDGMLLMPLQHSHVFELPLELSRTQVVFALLALCAAVAVRRRAPLADRARSAIALAAGILALWSLASPDAMPIVDFRTRFAIALPLAWVALLGVSRSGADPQRRFTYVFIAALAVLETLNAYPVAGSQVAFSTFLLVPVSALCLAQAWPSVRRPMVVARLAAVFAAVLVVKVAVGDVVEPLRDARADYRAGAPLRLHGTGGMRLPGSERDNYRGIAAAIQRHCSTFLTLPGMNSLYLMTDRRPPTGFNTTGWMYILDEEQQERVVDSVAGTARLCVVRNDELVRFWSYGRPIPDGPLYRFVTTGVRPVATHGGYVLEVKP